MSRIFYLDDRRLIHIDERLDINYLKLYCQDKNLPFGLSYRGEQSTIHLINDYDFEKEYYLRYKGKRYELNYRYIFLSEAFEKYYRPDLNKLGSFYRKEASAFRVFAPLSQKVEVLLGEHIYKMNYIDRGIYELNIAGDYEGYQYAYLVTRNNSTIRCLDPFSYSCSYNSKYSLILDINKFSKPKYQYQEGVQKIIYELNVRDFSSIAWPGKYPKTFKSLTEKGLKINNYSSGLDYLKELGITHIQLMPILDFTNVDEIETASYNWGYDPLQYNCLEGSYIDDKEDCYSRVNEFIEVVDTLHKEGLAVNVDVVFNHVFDVEDFSLATLIPYYCFRYDNNYQLSNGSFCGSEIRSEAYFMREYLSLMLQRLETIYNIDGIRFDLLGLLDIETLKLINERTSLWLYGEGWQLPTVLEKQLCASIENAALTPFLAYFNDCFRDSIRGSEEYERGIASGNIERFESFKYTFENNYLLPSQSINYFECHDNRTFFDKLILIAEDDKYIKEKTKLALALLMVSDGIPFLHLGQEFLRSKKGEANTYCSGDEINGLVWNLRIENEDIVAYLKELIFLRQRYQALRSCDNKKAELHDHFLYLQKDNLVAIANLSENECSYYLDKEYKNLFNEEIIKGELNFSAYQIYLLQVV